jgi:hypothetical protein
MKVKPLYGPPLLIFLAYVAAPKDNAKINKENDPGFDVGDKVRATKTTIGCPAKEAFDRMAKLIVQRDKEAGMQLMQRANCQFVDPARYATEGAELFIPG